MVYPMDRGLEVILVVKHMWVDSTIVNSMEKGLSHIPMVENI